MSQPVSRVSDSTTSDISVSWQDEDDSPSTDTSERLRRFGFIEKFKSLHSMQPVSKDISVNWGDLSDEAYKVGDRVVYIDSDGAPPYVTGVDENNRTVEIPLTMSEVSLAGASGSSSTVSLPLSIEEDGESTAIFNSFVLAPDESGTMTLFASMDGDSSDLSTWVPMGQPTTDGFDELVPGVGFKVSGDDKIGWSTAYTSTIIVSVNGESTTPADGYQLELSPGSSTEMFDENGEAVSLRNLPIASDAAGNPIEFSEIVVVEGEDGLKRYVGVRATEGDDATVYQSYDLGFAPSDTPVGTFSRSESGSGSVGDEQYKQQYHGVHNSGGYEEGDSGLRDKKSVIILDENKTGSIDAPLSQGRREDTVVVTQLYDSSGEPLTYYLNGSSEGPAFKDQDKLVLPVGPGGEDEWIKTTGHTVDGAGNYEQWLHEPTGTIVYARGYEDIEFQPLEGQPISADEVPTTDSIQDYEGIFSVPSSGGSSSVLASTKKAEPGNYVEFKLAEQLYPFEFNTDNLTQFHGISTDFVDYWNDFEYRVDTLVEGQEPVVHYVELGSGGGSVILPGNSIDWVESSGDELNGSQGVADTTVFVHKNTGAIVLVKNMDDVQYTGNYDKA